VAYSKGKISANLNAMLDVLAYAEGTSTSRITLNDGYDVVVSGPDGPEIFSDYSTHPFEHRKAKRVNPQINLFSTAAGRYQHLVRHWPHYKAVLNLKDFGPESQDKWAIQLIRERRALAMIEEGRFDEAINRIANLWASLPGANYPGQRMRDLRTLRELFVKKGGKLWESNSSSGLSPQVLSHLAESSQPLNLVPIEEKQKLTPKIERIEPKPMPQGLWSQIKKLLTGK
jgi:muramidase (phage lysozyme)